MSEIEMLKGRLESLLEVARTINENCEDDWSEEISEVMEGYAGLLDAAKIK